ncbi:hypothetical protein Golob_005519 [Gossypium lobatum]|uniref:RNase H type-1 domain-containing protein n=1 Tax=Gossypium lobatum TaxID=34289 RepID=A0A7J8MTS8_9ROSI|nr:hypothetical protein [Gossypium lobatum]
MAKCRLIACAMWAIWTSRNKFIHEGEIKSGSQIADFMINYLKELDGLNTHLLVRRIHTDRWAAPNGLRVKLNFDVAFNRQRNDSCSGLVVRNERAEVIYSRTVMQANIPSVFAAEPMACLQALNIGLHIGLWEVEIEGDSPTEGIKKKETTYLIHIVPFGAEGTVDADRRWTESMRE